MKLFKRKEIGAVEKKKDQLAAVLAGWLEQLQSRWAAWMNRWFNRLGYKKKLACYYAMLAIGIGASIYSLMEVGHKRNGPKMKPQMIRSPAVEIDKPGPRLSDRELSDIQRFFWLMDSLSKNPTGAKSRDSILKLHPGLQDSILRVRELYNLKTSTNDSTNNSN